MLLRRKRGSREVPIEESSMKAESALPLEFPDSAPTLKTAAWIENRSKFCPQL